ncbi:MAG: SUMF1/EgtB/PvdO family nonheme iron enzyme [Bryobacteraceae bacterium]
MARPTLARLAALLALAAGAFSQTPDRALQQAGVCARCHVAQVLEWSAGKHTQANTVCQTCHGPSAGHVANERNQVKPDRRPTGAAIAALCAGCHAAGCPKTQERAKCETCHHVHALVNPKPAKLAPMEDPAAEQRKEAARRVDAGERFVDAENWKSALAEFEAASRLDPANRRAAARAKMARRRSNPVYPGFEIVNGSGFDKASGLPNRVTVEGVGVAMVLVPAADATIGADHPEPSRPIHSVALEPYYLATLELTQSEWAKLSSDTPSTHRGDALPVNNVSWNDAQRWIAALNARVPGGGFRLPTEAEWEHAAGGETRADQAAWFRDNSLRDGLPARLFHELDDYAPRAAGAKAASARGYYDLLGNVWEWCSSLYRPYPYDARDGREDASAPGLRVLRGGGYADSSSTLNPTLRHSERPDRRQPWNGFRLARSVPE